MELSKEQKLGEKYFLEGNNLFITGKAGSGKSTLVNHLIEKSKHNVAILAPTGISATNVSGSTFHRFFRFPLGILHAHTEIKRILDDDVICEKIMCAGVLIIDEISMVRADIFETVSKILKEVMGNNDPFGGKQIICVGDFDQLPPVVSPREETSFKKFYESSYSFSTEAWKESNFKTLILPTSFRQSNDDLFLSQLNLIKKGNPYAIEIFNNKCYKPKQEDAITLTTTNKIALDINLKGLNRLKTPTKTFKASVIGDISQKDYPTEEILSLKVGARVLMIANDNVNFDYCNGDLGTIIKINPNKSVIVELDNGNEASVIPITWEIFDYNVDNGNLKKTPIGEFIQLPLKLGYAITIHKSQGQTLEKINLEVGKYGCFCPGQLYVGLSRARTLNSITLPTKLKHSDVIISSEVKEFYKTL